MENFIKLISESLKEKNEENLKNNLFFIQKLLFVLFEKMQKTNELREAETIFTVLEDMQYVLAKEVFKEGVKVTKLLKQFIYDFDRADDPETRNFLYLKIKNKEYFNELVKK